MPVRVLSHCSGYLATVVGLTTNKTTLSGECYVSELSAVKVCGIRFQVLMAASMKVTVFWGFVPCSLVYVDQYFRVTALHCDMAVMCVSRLVYSSFHYFSYL
jgi:hypothetical protein